jgi:hypothetical protein
MAFVKSVAERNFIAARTDVIALLETSDKQSRWWWECPKASSRAQCYYRGKALAQKVRL